MWHWGLSASSHRPAPTIRKLRYEKRLRRRGGAARNDWGCWPRRTRRYSQWRKRAMLDKDTRTAILALSGKGYGVRRIARELKISRNSVRRVIQSGVVEAAMAERGSQLEEHLEEIGQFYAECEGNLVRVREKLEEALSKRGQSLEASYSALTWFCRRHGIGVEEPVAVKRIVTGPGLEMQHDTSPHTVVIGANKVKRQCASLVLGYSRMLYMQFYPRFQRFHMKMFLTDAFQYFGGCCQRCVIDNSSIAIACGTGRLAEVAPEVEAFEKRFGFKFLAHELGHKERSGKIEGPFHYIEHNFLAGRMFQRGVDAYGCVSVVRRSGHVGAACLSIHLCACHRIRPLRLFDGHKEL